MELTPQTLHAVEFREARRGGYNTRDVDDFIERVAASVGHLNERTREAQSRADAAEGRLTELQREVEELRRRPAAVPEVSETDETLRRTLVLAQRTADATIKEAKEEANRVLSEAREEAARTRAEAEAEARRGAQDAREMAQQEVQTLYDNRDKLKSDLDALSRRIEEQRGQIRSGITQMQRLLDDPSALKPQPPVAIADVERPVVESGDALGNGASDHDGSNGFAPQDAAANGGSLADLQEPPPPPSDLGPPTQPVPFALNGDGRAPWAPADLTVPGDEPLGPPPAPQPAGNAGAPPDPTNRPSEWGKAVFDTEVPDSESNGNRFGRRR